MTTASFARIQRLQYQAYGLTLGSDTPIPELSLQMLPSDEELTDIHVSLGSRDPLPAPTTDLLSRRSVTGKDWLAWAKAENGYLVRFARLAEFYLDASGRTIVGKARVGTTKTTLRHLLLDQVLPLALTLHGQHSLHATAVLTPAGVCAFTGLAGSGKSTLAASFLLSGSPVMSDDCLVLEPDGQQVMARAAYPGVRLLEDSLDALSAGSCPSLPVAQYTSKRRPMLGAAPHYFAAGRHPLVRIYVLYRHKGEAGIAPSKDWIKPLAGRVAFMELLTGSFILDPTDRAALLRQFQWLDQIVSTVPVRRLLVPDRFEALASVRETILADLTSP